MSEYTVDGVLEWALNRLEDADGAEFGMYSCIADAIQLYRRGLSPFACDDLGGCVLRRQQMLNAADGLYILASQMREAYGVTRRGRP